MLPNGGIVHLKMPPNGGKKDAQLEAVQKLTLLCYQLVALYWHTGEINFRRFFT